MTLITDNMAASVMARGLVDLVIVGTDRVTANGRYVVNKIGTLGVAILANILAFPFTWPAPPPPLIWPPPPCAQVEIEERAPEELTGLGGTRTAPLGMKVGNPAFDVTPHELVSGLITEHGVLRAPLSAGLQKLMQADTPRR